MKKILSYDYLILLTIPLRMLNSWLVANVHILVLFILQNLVVFSPIFARTNIHKIPCKINYAVSYFFNHIVKYT
jgi:hypothetical protein